MGADIRRAYALDNLRRAWHWLNTNPDASYKGFFRHIYRAYAISAEENLRDLRKRLANGLFIPQHANKLYLPKKSGIQRSYTLLSVEDQIVYQALVNIIAERMAPIVKRRYYKRVFGNLYSSKRGRFFYRDWRKGYRRFADSVRDVYRKGFIFSASFDLTACYDSIDHSVLAYFLEDLGLQREFVNTLCEYLKLWTAAPAEERIYQGHGIPQGPLSSGLLSEVVLRFFDENYQVRPRSWRYFRYVDDIRFFAKKERDLRSVLVQMDLLSKRIGLFPQSSKIDIHRIGDIENEIKSISHPPEPADIRRNPNQPRVRRRLAQLSPRLMVRDETRFKYVLASAMPNARLSNRLIRILVIHPHLYVSIYNYFQRYARISKVVCGNFIRLIKGNQLYSASTAAGIRVLRDHCHPDFFSELEEFAREIYSNENEMADSNLRAAAISALLVHGKMKWDETIGYLDQEINWWARSEVARYVQIEHVGSPSYQFLLNKMLCDNSVDVSMVAVDHLSSHALELEVPIERVNPIAQLALKKIGMIGARRGGPCPISRTMQAMIDPSLAPIKWRRMLAEHYRPDIAIVIKLKAYSQSDATAWVNLLDTFHDDLLDSLFRHEAGALGKYRHGNIGAVLTSANSRFATKFPSAYDAISDVHQTRLESMLSHPITRNTGRRTRYIEFAYIRKIKPKLSKAYREIWRKW